MRKTADLVKEMLDAAKGARLVAIAVGFTDETQFVFSTDLHPLEKLNGFITKGGSPIGLLRFVTAGSAVQGSYRPFEEYTGQEWVNGYLAGLLDHAQEIVAQSDYRYIVPAPPAS